MKFLPIVNLRIQTLKVICNEVQVQPMTICLSLDEDFSSMVDSEEDFDRVVVASVNDSEFLAVNAKVIRRAKACLEDLTPE